MMAWCLLLLSAALETAGALVLKHSSETNSPLTSCLAIGVMTASVAVLSFACRSLPIGVAYSAWTGTAIVGTVVLGSYVFREPLGIAQWTCLTMILVGIAGLKLASKTYA